MDRSNYIYIKNESLDVYHSFALEYYLTSEKTFSDKTVFLIWRTTPTVMVGKFQNTYQEINGGYVEDNDITVVRRMSGGGTIFTDLGGWQFSFITPAEDKSICLRKYTEPILEVLQNLGVEAYFDGRNDIMVDGKKISGNAQYMRNGFVVHHGSLLYSTDLEMLERSTVTDKKKMLSKGVKSVREHVGNISDYLEKPLSMAGFRDRIVNNFIEDESQICELSAGDYEAIKNIAENKFNNWENIYGKNPEFDIMKKGRCEGGDVECRLNVKKGSITDIDITGNFFGNLSRDDMTETLKGCRYEYASIKRRLSEIFSKNEIIGVRAEDLADIICGAQ